MLTIPPFGQENSTEHREPLGHPRLRPVRLAVAAKGCMGGSPLA